jgi:hypothetical protein
MTEINAAFDRPDALFVAPVPLFTNRRMQLASLAARERIPAVYAPRVSVEVGGLMSYGTDRRTKSATRAGRRSY